MAYQLLRYPAQQLIQYILQGGRLQPAVNIKGTYRLQVITVFGTLILCLVLCAVNGSGLCGKLSGISILVSAGTGMVFLARGKR